MPYPASTLYPGASVYPESAAALAPRIFTVRERPPLRLSVDVTTPSGRHYRWGSDEPDPANVPNDLRFSSTMPGGFESKDCKLARKPGTDYADLERLSTVRALGVGGEVASETRLERTPRTSGNEFSISPSAVGWQACLDDDKSAREIYIDRDLSHWGGPSIARKLAVNPTFAANDGSTSADTDVPKIRTGFTGPWGTAPARPLAEAWYDSLGLAIGKLVYAWTRGVNVLNADTNWTWATALASDLAAASADASANLRAAGPGSGTLTATVARKFAVLNLLYANVAAGDSREYAIDWSPIIYGDHGLTDRGGGFYSSDLIAHAVAKWAPLLRITADSIQDHAFLIEQFAFLEATTCSEIVKQANRFHLSDWAVWEDRTFYYHQRGARGRSWRARIAPAQLEETGPQLDRLYESVIVQFSDVDGTTKTVGPPGSGATAESALLKDADPENPANKLGITRRDLLTMGTSTAAGATEVGARFLTEQKLLDSSGRAQMVGWVEDDHGIKHPAWRVRAGDTVTFVDAADSSSARRIVKADYSHSTRTCSVDLDSPPEGMAALLERLGAVLSPLGLTA